MRFRRLVLVTAFLISVAISVPHLQARSYALQDIAAEIDQAEDFYYGARFSEALALLSTLNVRLEREGGSPSDRAKVKLLIGLCHLALDNAPQAHSGFLEFCVLDPGHVLDETRFPPKVISFFKEMGTECSECVRVCSQPASVDTFPDSPVSELRSRTSCRCASPAAGQDVLSRGRELLAQKKYLEALKEFQSLLETSPANDTFRQAVDAAQKQIDDAVRAAISEWRTMFSSRQFERAATTYDFIRWLENVSTEEVKKSAREITAQYETTFKALLTSWNSACLANDTVALNAIRLWSQDLDPYRTIQPDAIGRMQQCAGFPSAGSQPTTSGK
jgi:hypothetical protein